MRNPFKHFTHFFKESLQAQINASKRFNRDIQEMQKLRYPEKSTLIINNGVTGLDFNYFTLTQYGKDYFPAWVNEVQPGIYELPKMNEGWFRL